jgi:SAM-dependent methyltransferase
MTSFARSTPTCAVFHKAPSEIGPAIDRGRTVTHIGGPRARDTDMGESRLTLPRENVFGHTKKVALFREAIDRLRASRGGDGLSILDVGCGSGHAVTRFLGGTGDRVHGIDSFAPNIEYAQRVLTRPGLSFECRLAESLAADRERFDVVVLADVLEHLDDPGRVLEHCRALVAPCGVLLVTIPNGYGPFECESFLSRVPLLGALLLGLSHYPVAVLNRFGPLKGAWTRALSETPTDLPYNQGSNHVQFFTSRHIAALLAEAGFKVRQRRHLSFASGPFSNYLFAAWPRFCTWNARIADQLPAAMVSAWLIECEAA